MRACPEADAIVSIGDALDWDVAAGLQHLQTCPDCRAHMAALQLTRAALMEIQPVTEATVIRIVAALRAEGHGDRAHTQATQRWVNVAETLVAAIAAPVALISSGLPVSSVGVALLTAAMGAGLLTFGRRLRLHAA